MFLHTYRAIGQQEKCRTNAACGITGIAQRARLGMCCSLDKQGLPETHVGLCNPRPAERYGSQGEQSHNNQYNGNLREGHPAFVSGSHGAATKK
ncbi:hypothetical protein MAFF211471_50830 (plasmid) [Ralstonia solanacearum]|nr:hypothetical protein MAFF211471_50830 [Ralstonia solanacearum]BCN02559.1 hypothetical protein RPSA_50950 [Ralstonia solanacearum]